MVSLAWAANLAQTQGQDTLGTTVEGDCEPLGCWSGAEHRLPKLGTEDEDEVLTKPPHSMGCETLGAQWARRMAAPLEEVATFRRRDERLHGVCKGMKA